jgi:hypothetical protein
MDFAHDWETSFPGAVVDVEHKAVLRVFSGRGDRLLDGVCRTLPFDSIRLLPRRPTLIGVGRSVISWFLESVVDLASPDRTAALAGVWLRAQRW